MSFAELQQAIFDEASTEADQVRARYEAQLAKEETRIKEEAQRVEDTIISAAKTEAEQQARRLHQVAQLDAKAKILMAKQEELEETKRLVVAAVLVWNKEQAESLIESLLKLVPAGAGELQVGEVHEDIVNKLVDERGDVKVSDRVLPKEGGFIFKGEDMELNVTVDRLVEQLFLKHRAKLAETLFG